MQVKDIGERGLLERLHCFCPSEIIGDDGAVLNLQPGYQLVVTTDVLVDGVHFSEGTTPPEAVGWRAVAANLSDLAAMGAFPVGITVGLSVTGDTEVSWIEQLYQGMSQCVQAYSTAIVGGDVTRSPVNTLAITAFGEVLPHRVIQRRNAQPGDVIVVTGDHGASRAGLELLLHPEKAQCLTETARNELIQAHQYPKPRLDVLPILWKILEDFAVTQNSKLSIAGMDSSDGLADAIAQICHASGVGARVVRSRLPVPSAFTQLVSPEQALEWALFGGEDFELVLCLPDAIAQTFVAKLEPTAAIIGSITADPQVLLVDPDKKFPDEELTLSRGFQHF